MLTIENIKLALYFTPLLLIWIWFLHRRSSLEDAAVSAREAALSGGMTEPPSLHPVIDPVKCIGCRSCLNACPEMPAHQVLGIIGGKAELVTPADCIGHGACKEVCPADAIELVFGTEKRGVDIPQVNPDFETNVPGIFICGELGGMGLIRNAIEQGRHALESARKRCNSNPPPDALHVVIVGAGPAGFSASLAAKEHGLKFVTLEQDSLGGTVAHYPRGKLVMTAPATLPLYGKFKFTETTKEALLEFWQMVEKETGVKINYRERLENLRPNGQGYIVETSQNTYKTQTVLLAIGRRGTPRKLGVPGEDLPKVAYRLIDPEQFRGQHVLVAGGGDSALEAACAIAGVSGTSVFISYRAEAFTRAKAKNRDRVESEVNSGRLRVLMSSIVKKIESDHVILEQHDKRLKIKNDAVIVCAGGVLPTPFLKQIGIEVETKHGTV